MGTSLFFCVCECWKAEQRSSPAGSARLNARIGICGRDPLKGVFGNALCYSRLPVSPSAALASSMHTFIIPKSIALSTFSLLARLLPSRSRVAFSGTVAGLTFPLFVLCMILIGKYRATCARLVPNNTCIMRTGKTRGLYCFLHVAWNDGVSRLELLFPRGWKRAIPSGEHGLIRSLTSSAVDGAPCEHQHDARVLPQPGPRHPGERVRSR